MIHLSFDFKKKLHNLTTNNTKAIFNKQYILSNYPIKKAITHQKTSFQKSENPLDSHMI